MTTNHFRSEEKMEASLLKQILIGLVDVAIVLSLSVVMLSLQTPLFYQIYSSINPTLFVLILLAIYRLITMMLFNSTVGMKLLGVVLLNGEQQPLSAKRNYYFLFLFCTGELSIMTGNCKLITSIQFEPEQFIRNIYGKSFR